MREGYLLNTSAVYVGCNEFPTLSNGLETVEPSRYNFISPSSGDYRRYTVGPIDINNDSFYLIACAEISEVVCDCSLSNSDSNGEFRTEGSGQCGRGGSTTISPFLNFRASQRQGTEELKLNFELDIDSKVKVDIMTMNGIVLKSQVINDYKRGSDQLLNINTSRIRDRVLFVRLTTNQGVEIKKIILNRK